MKMFLHFSVDGFSNTYLIGPDNGGDAVIIDPGSMNVTLLNLIENNRFTIRHVLVTHVHGSHVAGLKTLNKIYDFAVYAEEAEVLGIETHQISGGETLALGEFSFSTFALHGHSSDSVAYLIQRCIFTGDTFGAGTIGSTPNGYARELLITEIRNKVLSLEENFLIFPGHGAPSTLEAERLINPIFS